MSVVSLRRAGQMPALTTVADPLAHLTRNQREGAYAIEAMIRPALQKMQNGIAAKVAAKWLVATGADGLPSWKTVETWLNGYRRDGVIALADLRKGRVRAEGGWEAKALEYFRLPSCPADAHVALWLREDDGFAADDATESRVRLYRKSLAADAAEFHPSRVGPHFRRQNLKPYVIRDRSVLPVGLVYQGDGHSLHYYVQHPNDGHHFKPELTPWMDVRSRFIAGFWLGFAESAVQTLYSLSSALLAWDHVPGLLHVDPGSGFKNRAICDAVAGFAPRIGCEFMTALPGNAKGKGDIEGWFKHFEARHGNKQPSYAGPEVPQEFLRNLEKRIERGQMIVPSFEEALQGISRAIRLYNERNQEGLGGVSPAKLWEQLERNPLHIPATVLTRPRETRIALRYGVTIFNRMYRSPTLSQYQSREVQVEYDLHNDELVWIYDMQGRFVTEATKVHAAPFLSSSRIEDLQVNRERNALKRLEVKADLVRAKTHAPITADATLTALEGFGAVELPPQQKQAEGLPPLDLLDTGY